MKGAQDMGVCVQEWTGRKVARMSDFVSWSACLTSICSKLHKYNLGFLADWESPLHFLTSDIKPWISQKQILVSEEYQYQQ